MTDKDFSKEFKKEAVKQVVVLEHSVASVSERLGVPEHRLSNWVNAYIRLKDQIDTDELGVLRKENKRLKNELKLAMEELELLRKTRLRQRKA
ncbi:MAG: transposase [Gammaproteobacteria bacterium]|jgi:transposase-like protein